MDALRPQIERLYEMDFYRQKLDRAGIRPSHIRTIKDFQQLPFTSEAELLGELGKAPSACSLYSSDVTRINFSPSGQDLFPVYQTRADIHRMHQVCGRSLEAAGVEKGDICAVTFGYHLFIAGLFYQGQLEDYGAKVIPLGPGESERAWKVINDHEVTVLISNPTFAAKLAAQGIPGVRILFVGGEPFTSVEGAADRVRSAFGGPLTIIDSYSMAACMPIARSCRYEKGLHIMDDFVYAEVVDPVTGDPLPYGERGELVLTHLYKEAAPLLRYRTGDLTHMERDLCECGRELTLPKSVVGRTDEMLKVKGVKFWPSQIRTILRAFPELTDRYRVAVRTERGVDRLELLVEGDPKAEIDLDHLSRCLKRETLVAFNKIKVVGELDSGPSVQDDRKGRNF
jgi:phenylacetate-CoA ligase